MQKTLVTALVGLATAGAVSFAAPAHAYEFDLCPSGLSGVVTDDTSCAFADSVRSAWYAQPGTVVTAVSPKTQRVYTMHCTGTRTDVWNYAKRCVGVDDFGTGLIVVIS